MVREIIHVQVGQCGNQIGNIFWNTTCDEHHLDSLGKFEANKKVTTTHKKEESKENNDSSDTNPNPSKNANSSYDDILLDKIGVYYQCASDDNRRYTPRAVLVDLEPGTLDKIQSDSIGALFKPDNFIRGANGCANNWAKGRFTEGLEVIDEILDVVRHEAEQADCVQAFQMCHSLAGGTGSGLGTLILNRIREEYYDRMTCAFSVYPSPRMSDVVVEPYNTMLAVAELIECADQSFTIDNEALVRILTDNKVSTSAASGFGQYNELISYVMSGITSSLRFPGQLNGDLRKMSVNLVPFPRLHFFVVSQSPLLTVDRSSNYTKLTTAELTNSVMDRKSYYVNIDPENGKFLTASVIYRGRPEDITTFDVDKQIANLPFQSEYLGQFAEWIPNNFKYSLISVGAKGWDSNTNDVVTIPMSATFVANHTAIKDCFKLFMSKFKALYARKAFLHWYYEEGMDDDNFAEASLKINDLITEYQERGNLVVTGDDDDFDPDDIDDDDEDAILAKYSNKDNGGNAADNADVNVGGDDLDDDDELDFLDD